jgi:hypothetical protein
MAELALVAAPLPVFRIPLLRPTYRIQSLYRHLQWLFQPATAWIVLGLTLLGVVLTLRQWDTFRHTLFEIDLAGRRVWASRAPWSLPRRCMNSVMRWSRPTSASGWDTWVWPFS